MREKLKAEIGKSYGLLTILCETEPIHRKSGAKERRIECKCDCGVIKNYAIYSVLNGVQKDCGCVGRKNSVISNKLRTKHGMCDSTEYSIWQGLKDRCINPKNEFYHRYGGRGIKVCAKWLNKEEGFKNFFTDMGLRPSIIHSIDRIDNNGDYCKENCRWATPKQQGRNKSINVFMEHQGEKKTLSEWAEIIGITPEQINYWRGKGLTIGDLINKKFRQKNIQLIDTSTGVTYLNAHECSKAIGINKNTLVGYLKNRRKNKTTIRYVAEE